jgi:MFS family permease
VSERVPGTIPRPVWALLFALFFSALAVVGLITIVGKQVFDMTGDPLDLGLLGLAEFIPVALFSPFTGSIADRFDRRRVFALGLAGEASVALALFGYVSTSPTSVLPIFALVSLFGVARAFVAPSSRALPIDLAPIDVVERVVAMKSVAFQAGLIVGPVMFGLVFVAGPEWPYLVAVASFLASMSVLSLVGPVPVAKLETTGSRQALHDALEGLLFIRRRPVVFGAISLDLFAVLFGGIIALLPAIAEERLGVGAVGLGGLRAATGIGAGAVAITMSVRPIRRHVGRVLLSFVAVFGVCTILLALTTQYLVAFGLLLVAAAADSVSVFIRSTVVPLATPASMRGRVLAVENVFIGASNELGHVESGVAAAVFGLVGAMVFGGVGTLAVVVIWWRWFPALRDVDRFADAQVLEPQPAPQTPPDPSPNPVAVDDGV